MKEELSRVINKIILPNHPEVKDFYIIKGGFSGVHYYDVTYEINSEYLLVNEDKVKLSSKTYNLFQMLGPNRCDAVCVFVVYNSNFNNPIQI